jgi:protein-S-isoprenylcysteine O-methyltransferase Ste14
MLVFAAIACWFLLDVYLGVRVKRIADSKIKLKRKIALIGANVILALVAIGVAVSL